MEQFDDAGGRPVDGQHLEFLRNRHRELDIQIENIAARAYLTPEDQVELASLKKIKLKLKDEIFELAENLGLEV